MDKKTRKTSLNNQTNTKRTLRDITQSKFQTDEKREYPD